jgi:allantoinase
VRGFKCFLVPSGVDEFPHVSESDLREAMPVIARIGLPLLVHAEDPAVIERATRAVAGAAASRYATWLASRPPEAEVEAIRMMVRLCEDTGCQVHVVHLSASEALPDLRAARARGLPITVETCPHHLVFAAEDIPDRGTLFKCAPPIRDRANREQLWEALIAGDIDMVVSDHSPCPPALKLHETGDFMRAWGGIASLELGLAAVWTEAERRGVALEDVVRWMSVAPARLAGFGAVKGRIEEGYDADLAAFDTEAEWVVDETALQQRHPVTPYAGMEVRGRAQPVSVSGAFGLM